MNVCIFRMAFVLLVVQLSRQVVHASTEVNTKHDYYTVKPVKLGVEVFGIRLNDQVSQDVIDQIKEDIHKYRIMIFRDQGKVSGTRHVEISKWFGELDSTFRRHPVSPDLDVFRVSNDGSEGFTGIGRTGWHMDGSHQLAPFAIAIYHMYHVPKKGDTGRSGLKVNFIITGLHCFRYFLYILLFGLGAFTLEIFTHIFDSADCFHGHARCAVLQCLRRSESLLMVYRRNNDDDGSDSGWLVKQVVSILSSTHTRWMVKR